MIDIHSVINTETTLVCDSIYAAKESLCNRDKCFQKQLPFETDIFSTQHIYIYLSLCTSYVMTGHMWSVFGDLLKTV